MKRIRKYYNYLDELKQKELTGGPDLIPDLLGKFPELNKVKALDLVIGWAEREAVK